MSVVALRLSRAEVVVPVGCSMHTRRFTVTLSLDIWDRFQRRHVYPQGSLAFYALGPVCVMVKAGDWPWSGGRRVIE